MDEELWVRSLTQLSEIFDGDLFGVADVDDLADGAFRIHQDE